LLLVVVVLVLVFPASWGACSGALGEPAGQFWCKHHPAVEPLPGLGLSGSGLRTGVCR
jgi:hypothetical protein